jgi:serine/threonine protein kinase
MTDENDHGQAGLSVPALEHIDRVCLKFEAAWKEGHKPRIEDYLGAVRGPERNGLLRELLLLDIDYRNGVDESATEAEYRERFAHDLQLVSDVFRQYYSEGFVDQPAMALDNTRDEPSLAARVGETIGPYKLMEQIGEGGMGIVYVAEQYAPVRRKVALKIIKPGMDTREMIARFEAERQALALMDHPNIAKVLDAGTTRAGRPYFVMELVKGIPVTQYCDDHRLTPKERLELLIPICQAVQHAHQKGVIHRDIKPSNVLMALYDVQPVPKVIDFGVAKATNQKLTENTMFTQFGQIVGTLEYMSPEQANLNQLDVDTRSDIYSLGVLLYELLTGCTPFTKERLRSAAFEEMLRIIREE